MTQETALLNKETSVPQVWLCSVAFVYKPQDLLNRLTNLRRVKTENTVCIHMKCVFSCSSYTFIKMQCRLRDLGIYLGSSAACTKKKTFDKKREQDEQKDAVFGLLLILHCPVTGC